MSAKTFSETDGKDGNGNRKEKEGLTVGSMSGTSFTSKYLSQMERKFQKWKCLSPVCHKERARGSRGNLEILCVDAAATTLTMLGKFLMLFIEMAPKEVTAIRNGQKTLSKAISRQPCWQPPKCMQVVLEKDFGDCKEQKRISTSLHALKARQVLSDDDASSPRISIDEEYSNGRKDFKKFF
ncbi:hypothetical protein Tco_1218472 [Tanacetum coccineum]